MTKCRNPDHPHCTQWVLDGAGACAGGHAQPAGASRQPESAKPAAAPASSFELVTARRATAAASPERRAPAYDRCERRSPAATHPRPTLHVSGFDPRAAGGRQALRLELRGMPHDVPPQMVMHLRSALLAQGYTQGAFGRTRHGEWPPAVIEFSSRGRDHGQYPIEVELLAHREGAPPRRWTCTVVVLVPRPDATLTEIHQTFLATHKNVRVMADDASIARLGARTAGGRLDIDLTARNASIAQLNLDDSGGTDLVLPSIAWDEELIETGVAAGAHPQPAREGCILNPAPAAGEVRHMRLFALDECVLGRLEAAAPIADVLLAHYGEHGPDTAGLTRRLSAQHAVLRRGLHGFEIEDISRYGLLLDGVWPGKHVPVALRPGMRIELTASVRKVVTLEVGALLPHAVVLHRVDEGRAAESFWFLAPDSRPAPGAASPSRPLIYHADGGFWHLDRATGRTTALGDGARCGSLSGMPAHARFAAAAYPDLPLDRTSGRGHALHAAQARAINALA